MYKYAYYDRNTSTMHLADDEMGNQSFPYTQTCYLPVKEEDSKNKLRSIYGHFVNEVDIASAKYVNLTFERDIQPAKKCLIDLYYDIDAAPKYTLGFLDIETDSENGYPIKDAYDKPIISIAFRMNKITHVFFIDKYSKWNSNLKPDTDSQIYYKHNSEFNMLTAFINKFAELKPDIITTWHGASFDIPYIINRSKKIVGVKQRNKLSPFGIIDEYYNQKHGTTTYKIVGVSHIDYLLLYKKFAESKRDSYSLDNISYIEVGEGKLEYDGSLNDLYVADIHNFMDYNEQDTVLLEKLEQKLNYIDIAVNVAVKGKINFEDVLFPSMIIDGAITSFMRKNKLVAPTKMRHDDDYVDPWKFGIEEDDDEKAEGAYVKLPPAGLYPWLSDLDATSMYPSLIRTLNISPETKIGKILDWWEIHLPKYVQYRKDGSYATDVVRLKSFDGQDYELSYVEIENYCRDANLLLSCNGILYSQDKRGIIPMILDDWYAERKHFQTLKKTHAKEALKYLEGSAERKMHHDLEKEYDIKQYRMKILLNTTFGVLLSKSFRYYDEDNGEAITISGQVMIKFAEAKINEFLSNKLGKEMDFIQLIDTDSLFIKFDEFIDKDAPDEANIQMIKKLTSEVQTYINIELKQFTISHFNCTESSVNYLDMKQEMIAKTGFFNGAKKRYMLWIVDKEGIPKNEMFVRGIDVRRSDFPLYFKDKLEQICISILNGADNKKVNEYVNGLIANMYTQELKFISIPKGVSSLTKFISKESSMFITGTPENAKASIYYNYLLEVWGLTKTHEPIYDGEKIRIAKLKRNEYNIPVIAFKDKMPDKMDKFIRKYIDANNIFRSVFENKLIKFYKALGWTRWDSMKNENDFF